MRVKAIRRVQELVDRDTGPEKGRDARAIRQTLQELELTVSKASVYSWIKEVRKIAEEDLEAEQETHHEWMLARLRVLRSAGHTPEEAVRLAYSEAAASGPVLADIETIRRWMDQICATPVVRKHSKR